MTTQLKSLATIARERGISARALRRAIRAGELDAVRLGLRALKTTDDAVDRWLRRMRVPASPSAERRAAAVAASIAESLRRPRASARARRARA